MALNYITTANTNNQGRLIVNEMLTYLATGATAGVDAGTFQLETFGGTPITGETRLAGNYIIDGMTVRKDSTNNLKFNVYPGSYLLNGTVYSFNGGSVTLSSNATAYDRIDLIYANASGVNKTTGTAASPTLSPSYTETTQLPLSFVLVQSGATAGSGGVGQIGGGAGNRVASTGETVNFGIFGEATGDRSINLGQFGKVSGKNSISIGGKYNYITADNVTLIGGEGVTASTANRVLLGKSIEFSDPASNINLGTNNSVVSSTIVLGDSNTIDTINDYESLAIFGNNNNIQADFAGVFGRANNMTVAGSGFIYGNQNEMTGSLSSIIGGSSNVVYNNNSHIIGGVGYSSTTDNTLTVPSLDIREGLRRDYAYNNSSTAVTLSTTSKSVQLFNTSARKYWVTLPNTTGVDSMVVTFKALNDAGTNNVVISGFTGESIDGNPDYTLNTNFQTVTLLWASDYNYWLSI